MDDEAQRQARLAAMQRAAQGATAPADGTAAGSNVLTSGAPTPGPDTSNIGGIGAAAGALGSAIASPTSSVNSGTSAIGAKLGTSATSAATGGSLGATISSESMAAVQRAIAAANAANAARNKPPTVTPTVTTGTTTTGTTGTTGTTDTSDPFGYLRKNAADSRAFTDANPAGTTDTTGAGGTDTTGGGITDQTGGAGPGGQDGSGGGQGGDLGSITNQLMGQIQGIGSTLANPGTPTDVTGVFLTQAKSILSMLDQQDAEIRAEAEKNGTTVDPSTQFTIDKLRETLTENVKTVREDLNRRGLSDSGIELELENRLQKGSASDQARILADRLTSIQDQLSKGLASNRAAKVSTLSTFGMGAANAQQQHNENQYQSADERERAALTAMLGLRGQVNSSEMSAADNRSAMQRALLQEQGQNSRSAASLSEEQRQYNETFGMNKAKYNQDFAYNAQNDALNRAAKGAGTGTDTPKTIVPAGTQYVNGYGSGDVTKGQNVYGGTTSTGNNVDSSATNAAISAINNASSRDQAQTDLFKSAQALINAGVDVTAVQDAINKKFPAAVQTRTVGGSI